MMVQKLNYTGNCEKYKVILDVINVVAISKEKDDTVFA
jgi:hypothetical protein